jgi:hypothetical protein
MRHLKGRKGRLLVLVLLLVSGFAVTACGGGSSSTEGSQSVGTSSSGGAANAEFLGPGENGTLAQFGRESSAAEREAASKVLKESFTARAAKDWAGQCSTLNPKTVEQIEAQAAKVKKKGCTAKLTALAEGVPASVLKDPMSGPVAVLRVKGSEAFAFFHGAGGVDYVIPMEKDHGHWKVGALSPEEAP